MRMAEVLFNHGYIKPEYNILDIGCGNKAKTNYIKNKLTKGTIKTLDAWEKTQPDYLIDVGKNDLPFKENEFDTIIMLDFIEHLEKNRGFEIIEQCKKICKKHIAIYTPLWWTDNKKNVENPKGWYYNNHYDLHQSLWKTEDFKDFKDLNYGANRFFGVWSK